MSHFSRLLPLALLLCLSCFDATALRAMTVEPMLLDLNSSGKGAQQSFSVLNNSTAHLPVDIKILQIDLGPNGETKSTPVSSEFLIYPPQAMILPGGSQVFRVQWIGEPDISASRSYRLMVSQVPVKLAKDQSGIQIVTSFGVTVNVAPPGGKSEIVVTRVESALDTEGKRRAALTVKNLGNKHAYMRQSAISLSGGGWSAEMTPSGFAQQVGFGIVQPGKERRFVLPIEVPAGVSAIKATVKYDPAMR